ncbi:hypothetical protein BGZ75_000161 [Mortierella antarctica]|nr:hypothetical protein BGZ67_006433 [Mortierella alpina]KAF9987752.1 hypothetical protein BGZ75_000161 [Mortierella antarctica]
MMILEIPDEILYHLLTYAEDTDLQNLALTCKRLRSIALDGPLRRHILLIRTPARLNSSLSARPSRDVLATQNILRGIHVRQNIQQGQYIGGAASVRSYHVSCRLERQMVSLRIAKKLRVRPDWTELVERGLIPAEMFVTQEDSEAKQKWTAYRVKQRSQRQLPQLQQHLYETPEAQSGGRAWNFATFKSDAAVGGTAPISSTPARSMVAGESSTQYQNRPRRQRKSISMVLVPKIELLRKAMDRDRLSRLVQKRPSPSELNQSPKTATVLRAYHLIAFSTISPDLVPLTAQLSFLLKGERLSHWLYSRPSLSVMLNERHLLKTDVRTAWMVCPGVSQKVKFYEGLIQETRHYEQQQEAFMYHMHPYHHAEVSITTTTVS